MNKEYKESPFYPGKPVPTEYFVAREQEINEIMRIIQQSSRGRNESIFIQGERGIGKSSLADFILFLAERKLNFIGSHCYLSGAKGLENVVRIVFQNLINEASDEALSDKLRNVFGSFIKGFSFYGIGVEFTKDEHELKHLVSNFGPSLRELYHTIKNRKDGILLILDDLNGLSDTPDFSPYMKSFFDNISSYSIPFTLIFVGLPERRGELIHHQASIARIFKLIELNPFSDNESKKFFIENFNRVEIEIEDDALETMVYFSGGFPALMHEVGDAVFLKNDDEKIDDHDCNIGIIDASYNIGKRYLDEQVIRELQSDTYQKILKKIAKSEIGYIFTRKELLELFSDEEMENEKRSVDNFLRRMKKLKIIIPSERGSYQFVNHLYHVYCIYHAFAETQTKKIEAK